MKTAIAALISFLLCGGEQMRAVEMVGLIEVESIPRIEAGQRYKLRISSVPKEERARWNRSYPIGRDGKIRLPFVGEIKVSGMLIPQAEQAIEKHLRTGGIYTKPKIRLRRDPKD